MQYFQILDCSSELGTCCTDYGLVMILDALRKIMNLIQLIAPILLIIMCVIGFAQLMFNPEKKGGIKSIVNKFLAAVFIFFMPIIVDAVLLVLPETFSVSSCWNQAKISAEVSRSMNHEYISPYEQTESPILISPDDYESSKAGNKSSSGSSSSSTGSQKGQEVVSYAKKFIGQAYVYGGSWNGEEPYTPTDCSGFVQGIFSHFGVSLGRDTDAQWAGTDKYTLVSEDNLQAGDVIMYDGHVGIYTGTGKEIVHAKGTNYGIVLDSDYTQCSSHAILGFMRINGIN